MAGIVEAWGEMEIHADGFRAELARPLAFFLAGNAGPERRARVQALAAAHEARVVVLDHGADLGRACAALAPAALDPAFVRALVSDGQEPPQPARRGRARRRGGRLARLRRGDGVVLAVWGLIGVEAVSLAADLLGG